LVEVKSGSIGEGAWEGDRPMPRKKMIFFSLEMACFGDV